MFELCPQEVTKKNFAVKKNKCSPSPAYYRNKIVQLKATPLFPPAR